MGCARPGIWVHDDDIGDYKVGALTSEALARELDRSLKEGEYIGKISANKEIEWQDGNWVTATDNS